MVLAKEYEALAVIDDEVARKTAKVYGIEYVGTPYILISSVFEGLLSKEAPNKLSMTWSSVAGGAA